MIATTNQQGREESKFEKTQHEYSTCYTPKLLGKCIIVSVWYPRHANGWYLHPESVATCFAMYFELDIHF